MYKCSHARRKLNNCKKKNVRKKDIECTVVSLTMQMLNDDSYIQRIVTLLMEQQNKENTFLPHLKISLGKHKRRLTIS